MLVLWWKAVNLRARLWLVHTLQREKFEVILLIKPRTLEILKREIGPSSKRERIDGKLDMSVLLFPRLGLVIENLQITIADLQEVDVPGNEVIFEVERESAVAIISDVLAREVHRDFDCDGGGVVDEHEALERLMAFLVGNCSGKYESRKTRGIVFFSRDWNRDPHRKFGRAVFGCLKHAVWEVLSDSFEIVFRTGEMMVVSVLKQQLEFRLVELETVHLLVA